MLVQAVKAEEPKLEQAAKTEMTGAGGAGTTASGATAAAPAGECHATTCMSVSDDALPTSCMRKVHTCS